jgi:uncharacterized membrane protein YkvA (DUF1232 family)
VAFDLKSLRERARQVKIDLIALSLATRDPRTPWYAKLIVAGCVAYALSPVDLVPDFIPVIGLIDDLIFIPIALALAVRFIPDEVLAECHARAGEIAARRTSRIAAAVIIGCWVLLATLGVWLLARD